MGGSSFGTIFRVTTFGESHGPALGAVVGGVPAGLAIDAEFIQSELDRRRPGAGLPGSTPRNEADRVKILSGVFEGVSTGTPIALAIENTNARSSDYDKLAGCFRPGHADYTYDKKYGLRDWRGGGRASGRETAARVAAGAVAKLLLKKLCGVTIRAGVEAVGDASCAKIDFDAPRRNRFYALDDNAVEALAAELNRAARGNDSIGGVVRCRADNLPAGWGEPVFDKLDALVAHAVMSIGAVKGIEFGDGFAAAGKLGSENNDAITPGGFASNHAGGVLGGISNGAPLVFRVAVKPTPSIGIKQTTVDREGNAREIEIGGRHDLCIVPRIVPVVEAMTAITLADLALLARSSRIG